MIMCRKGGELNLCSHAQYHVTSNIHIFKSILFFKGSFPVSTQENIHVCKQKHTAQTNQLKLQKYETIYVI